MENVYNQVQLNGELDLFIIKRIYMGDEGGNSITEILSEPNLFFKDGAVYINKHLEVKARIASNNWLEIKFENGQSCDIAFDNVQDYDKYFEVI